MSNDDSVSVGRDLPTGTVTFVFTDVEGSTRLLHELGADAYADALAEHRRVVRDVCAAHGGVEVDTQGDAFFVAFPTAPGRSRRRRPSRTGSPQDRSAFGSDCTRGHHSSPTRATLDPTSTGLPGSPHRATVGRCSPRRRPHRSSGTTVCATSASTGSKDLSSPERVYQLGEEDFPALKSLYRTNLPVPATPFLGREKELEEVVALLNREDVRLLTLTGPGGTGKTRLALQAAAEASDHYPRRDHMGSASAAARSRAATPRGHAGARAQRGARKPPSPRRLPRLSSASGHFSCSTTSSISFPVRPLM